MKIVGWLDGLEESKSVEEKVVEKPIVKCMSCDVPQSQCSVFIECELPGKSAAARSAGVYPYPFITGLCLSCWNKAEVANGKE
jgi:hypothetical protein